MEPFSILLYTMRSGETTKISDQFLRRPNLAAAFARRGVSTEGGPRFSRGIQISPPAGGCQKRETGKACLSFLEQADNLDIFKPDRNFLIRRPVRKAQKLCRISQRSTFRTSSAASVPSDGMILPSGSSPKQSRCARSAMIFFR